MTATQRLRISVPEAGLVSALARIPEAARVGYVLAHGAGAGMEHPFMQAVADRLFARRVATLRFNFPYMEAKKKRPDRSSVLEATVRGAVDAARERFGDLPLVAGGKSMGGRITSQAHAIAPLLGVRGLAFLGFPLHPAGKPATKRAEHLRELSCPTLFLQGTRDALADLELLTPIVQKLPEATLHVVEGGDHSFHVLKRSGRSDDEVLDELAEALAGWATELSHSPADLSGRLSGEELRALLRDFYDRLFADPMIGFLFSGKNKERLIEREWEFTMRLLGDKSIPYRGRTMHRAHAASPILGGHFERRLEILRNTLAAHSVPAAVQQRWIDHTLALRNQITTDRGSECADTAVAGKEAPERVLYREENPPKP